MGSGNTATFGGNGDSTTVNWTTEFDSAKRSDAASNPTVGCSFNPGTNPSAAATALEGAFNAAATKAGLPYSASTPGNGAKVNFTGGTVTKITVDGTKLVENVPSSFGNLTVKETAS